MKRKTERFYRAVLMTLLVFAAGAAYSLPASEGKNLPKRHENTASIHGDADGNSFSPAPVVDDSPINPDSAHRGKTVDKPKFQDSPELHQKKKVHRRR